MPYDPGHDAAVRYPDWVIRHRPLSHDIPEVMCRRRKVILIEAKHSWAEKRCSLAHAVAHLDLGHTSNTAGIFDRDQEEHANQLAARRMVTVEQLAAVLSWTRHDVEIAEELCVDLLTLEMRKRHLHPAEVAKLRRQVSWLEESA
jgi:Zn-dependent peptidase ImmA (M78 family)